MKKVLLLALALGISPAMAQSTTALTPTTQTTISSSILSLLVGKAPVANPITTTGLYKFETDFDIILTALQTYKKACVAGAADANCKANIAAIQVYTRQIPPYLTQLRGFVKNNDTVNATTVYSQLVTLYTNAKTTAANLGVSLGS